MEEEQEEEEEKQDEEAVEQSKEEEEEEEPEGEEVLCDSPLVKRRCVCRGATTSRTHLLAVSWPCPMHDADRFQLWLSLPGRAGRDLNKRVEVREDDGSCRQALLTRYVSREERRILRRKCRNKSVYVKTAKRGAYQMRFSDGESDYFSECDASEGVVVLR